jgi:hypothetical protein
MKAIEMPGDKAESLLKDKISSYISENTFWNYASINQAGDFAVDTAKIDSIRPEVEKFLITSGQDLDAFDRAFDKVLSEILIDICSSVMK